MELEEICGQLLTKLTEYLRSLDNKKAELKSLTYLSADRLVEIVEKATADKKRIDDITAEQVCNLVSWFDSVLLCKIV